MQQAGGKGKGRGTAAEVAAWDSDAETHRSAVAEKLHRRARRWWSWHRAGRQGAEPQMVIPHSEINVARKLFFLSTRLAGRFCGHSGRSGRGRRRAALGGVDADVLGGAHYLAYAQFCARVYQGPPLRGGWVAGREAEVVRGMPEILGNLVGSWLPIAETCAVCRAGKAVPRKRGGAGRRGGNRGGV